MCENSKKDVQLCLSDGTVCCCQDNHAVDDRRYVQYGTCQQHPVEVPLEDGRKVEPPCRVDEHYCVAPP